MPRAFLLHRRDDMGECGLNVGQPEEAGEAPVIVGEKRRQRTSPETRDHRKFEFIGNTAFQMKRELPGELIEESLHFRLSPTSSSSSMSSSSGSCVGNALAEEHLSKSDQMRKEMQTLQFQKLRDWQLHSILRLRYADWYKTIAAAAAAAAGLAQSRTLPPPLVPLACCQQRPSPYPDSPSSVERKISMVSARSDERGEDHSTKKRPIWSPASDAERHNDEKDKKVAKKEKSTDCDSALIPLLCVHG